MVTITNGTIDWPISCEKWALLGGVAPSGWTVKSNTCANYARQLYSPFASFGILSGDGTVRSVALSATDTDIFEVTGSPITDIGTFVLALKGQGARLFLAGHITGADDTPVFREIELSDLPDAVISGTGAANTMAYWDTDDTIEGIAKTYVLPDEMRLTDFVIKLRTALNAVSFDIFASAFGGELQTFGSMPLYINRQGNGVYMPSIAGSGVRVVTVAADGALNSAVLASGTVTSVWLSLPSIFLVTGSPVTTSGTLAATLANQAANLILASPNGSTGTPLFRALVDADIPNLDAAKITSGILAIARGGTGLGALGTALQLLRVNAGGTALEYFTLTAVTGSFTATRVPFASGASALTDDANLTWDNTNKRLVVGAGTAVGKYNSLDGSVTGESIALYGNANASTAIVMRLENVRNIGGTGNALLSLSVGGTTAGDPYILYIILSGTVWSEGVDNSDLDIFKIGPYSNLGNGALGLQILPTGEFGFSVAPDTSLAARWGIARPLGLPTFAGTNRAINNTYGSIGWNSTALWMEVTVPGKSYFKPIASDTTPTYTIGASAGTGATASISGNALAGKVTITTCTSSGTGQIIRVTLSGAWGSVPFVQLTARNAAAAAQMTNFYIGADNPAAYFDIYVVTALAASTTYILNFKVD